jgi:hypothetical protein
MHDLKLAPSHPEVNPRLNKHSWELRQEKGAIKSGLKEKKNIRANLSKEKSIKSRFQITV